MKKIIILFSSLAFLASCENEKEIKEVVSNNTTHEGKKLMELNCNACHSPTAGENARIAPPMIAVKKHYLENGISKDAFISSIQNWVENPSEEISKMPGAVRKFGIMPKAEYSKETVEQIADYLFTSELEKPEWFDDHYKKQHGKKGKNSKGEVTLSYEDIGMKYALSTKSQLGKNLMGAIQSKGVENAVTFCNVQAIPVTDSMSTEFNARIKRVSNKPRNSNNRANKVELAHIATFKTQLMNKEEMKPIVEEEGGRVNFYFPITTNAMCLQCHGTLEQELKLSTYDKIKALYPEDEAIGYDENQIRGIWSIEFDK